MRSSEVLRGAVGKIRREEQVLLGLWVFCVIVVMSTATGERFWITFLRYVENFAMPVLYLFGGSRIAFALEGRWHPRHPRAIWLKRFMFGDPAKRASDLDMDLEFLRGILVLFISLSIYSNVKTRVPFMNQALGDETFLAMDHALFGPGIIATIEDWFRGDAGVRKFFTGIYLHDYRFMLFLIFLVYLRRDTFALRWVIIAVAFTYLLGILITVALPSHGPCFMEPERFKYMRGEIIGRIQYNLAGFYDAHVRAVGLGRDVNTAPYFGIAAFPSLHVGHMVVMLAVAWRVWRTYAYLMIVVTFLTFIATIGFGWHYAVDAIGGLLLALGVTYVLRKRMEVWDQRRSAAAAPAGTPAPPVAPSAPATGEPIS